MGNFISQLFQIQVVLHPGLPKNSTLMGDKLSRHQFSKIKLENVLSGCMSNMMIGITCYLYWNFFFFFKCDLKNTTRKHKSKLSVGFAAPLWINEAQTYTLAAAIQWKLWFIVKYDAFRCPCLWITYRQIIRLNNLFLEKALMWTTHYLHQLPFSQLSVCIRSLSDSSSHAPAPRCA